MPAPMTKEALVAAAGESIHEYRKATRKMRWWWESLADFMLANPGATHAEMASHFNRTAITISLITNTDAFKAYYRKRRTEYEEGLNTVVRDKMMKVASTSLDVMLEKLEKKRDTLPLQDIQKTAELALKGLGYGAEKPAGTTVNVHQTAPVAVVPVDMATLAQARQAMLNAQQAALASPPVIDVEATPVEDETNGD